MIVVTYRSTCIDIHMYRHAKDSSIAISRSQKDDRCFNHREKWLTDSHENMFLCGRSQMFFLNIQYMFMVRILISLMFMIDVFTMETTLN